MLGFWQDWATPQLCCVRSGTKSRTLPGSILGSPVLMIVRYRPFTGFNYSRCFSSLWRAFAIALHQLFETVDLEDAGVTSHRLYKAGGWFATHLLLSASSVSVLMPGYRRILNEKYGRGRVTARSHGIFSGKPDPPDLSLRGNPTHRILAFGKWGTYKRIWSCWLRTVPKIVLAAFRM